ncbi:ornithine decarboxylase-like [Limulus polyphemus]|uniref:Ornithine decarboxylase-like n=1 Tax=Limulus polyphemus TaxID=6850 RepID=A0ABM1BGJ6_LIMPO|nr:ornithine decarboxylase-like [Limulus polyphemus]
MNINMETSVSNFSSEEIYLDVTMNELACKVTEDKKFEDPLLIADLREVVARLLLWRELLPGVETFFAMKSCDNDVVRRLMATLGSGFDSASKQEIQKLLEIGVKPTKIIFAHPVKFRTHIKFAASVGVHLMTFDCVEELLKIQECDPEARLVLRIRPPLESSLYHLGEKFGCSPDEACRLVQKARGLKMIVVGIS